MEYARDLGQVDLWEESLRRSLERRGKPRRSSVELHRLRPARDLTLGDVLERSAGYSELRRRAAARPAMPGPSVALGGVSALSLAAAATLPSMLSRRTVYHGSPRVLERVAARTAPHARRAAADPYAALPRLATTPAHTVLRRAAASPSAASPAQATSHAAGTVHATNQPVVATIASAHPTTSGGASITQPRIKHHRRTAPVTPVHRTDDRRQTPKRRRGHHRQAERPDGRATGGLGRLR